MLSFFNGAHRCYLSYKSYGGQMNVGCFLSLFYWMLKLLFSFDWMGFFSSKAWKPPQMWPFNSNAFIFVELKDEPSPKWYTGNDPPDLFSLPSCPIARTEERKHVFFCGVSLFFADSRSMPGRHRGRACQGRQQLEVGTAICGVIDGFFPHGRGWSSIINPNRRASHTQYKDSS